MNETTRIEGEARVGIPADVAAGTPPAKSKAPRWRLPAMASLPIILIAIFAYVWLSGGKTVSTDNAEVGAHVVSIAPEISGRIVRVGVSENQEVTSGDLLFAIDPAPYRIALMQAAASVGNAELEINQMNSGYSAKLADSAEKASDVELAAENFRRQRELLGRGFTTRANYDAARAALAAARASQSSAIATAQSARDLLATSGGSHPQVAAAEAMRAKAALDLARTEIRAPVAGRVVQTDRLEPGNMAVQAIPMVTLVDNRNMWIEANFKETQLAKIRPGQRAEIAIDAVPGRSYRAHVGGIGAGTGAEFSLLPAQNATGNWVKVTQRVPVRLILDEVPDRPLVAGWSAHVTVHVAG